MQEQMPVGLRFSLLHRSFKKKMDAMLSEKDLTGVQFGVLGALVRLERSGAEEISQRDLEQATHMAHPTMTDVLRRLEKKGFLCCRVSSRDRRYKCISSTEKALALKNDALRAEEETFQWLCRGLSREQVDTLLEITDHMLANLMADCEKGCESGT